MNIVQLSTMDMAKAVPITTSLIIAEQFGKQHFHVLADIRRIFCDIAEYKNMVDNASIFGCVAQFEPLNEIVKMESKIDDYYIIVERKPSVNGLNQTTYSINEELWMMLVMGYTGKKAFQIKDRFIKQFRQMRHELLAHPNTRKIGKIAGRKPFTDSIKDHVEDGTNFKKFAYSNYTRLVYKRVLGMDVKKAKELRKLKESDNLRDFMTIEELERVQDLESKIATFIEISDTEGKDDKQVYQMVKEWLDRESPKQGAITG